MEEEEKEDTLISPFHSVPFVIVILSLAILGIELVFQLAEAGIVGGPRGIGWRTAAVDTYGFSPAVLERVLVHGDYSFNMLKRFVTFHFVNWQLVQTAFCAALTLAIGKFTAGYYGGLKVAVLYFFTAAVGAVVYGFLLDGREPLFGGFTPVYGLIGAYTYALWLRLGKARENQILAFRLIGFLLLIQLIFGLIFGSNNQWIAELSSFLTGFLLSIILAPGGWSSLLARMRERS